MLIRPTSLLIWFLAWPLVAISQESPLPERDRRATEIRHLNASYRFDGYQTKEAWLARAQALRHQILMSAGLWPMPEKSPLNPQVFGRLEREGYSIEKVYFESLPGFYVTGNLYRPLKKPGPFPALLSPHGHWAYGRLENSELGSIPARCINLARQGHVVFSYDMVGYNDSRQVNHRLIDKRLDLWGVGSLGLHLWNSIRALDFLETLPDVDPKQLGCTGASGGGTQTFLLTAVDDRVQVSAPVNMISHYMQGGDVCENTANLRLDTNNMEIGALMAPRPLLLVSAAGDWTRDTPRVEFPAIQSVYQLLGAADKVETVQMFAQHNYNRDSREAVYAWFGRWFLNNPNSDDFRETSFHVEFPPKLLVFFERDLPWEAKSEQQIVEMMVQRNRAQLDKLRPSDEESLRQFREVMGVAMRHALAAEFPSEESILQTSRRPGPLDSVVLAIGRKDMGDRVPTSLWLPKGRSRVTSVALVIHPEGKKAMESRHQDLVRPLLRRNQAVVSIDAFNTGEALAQRDMSDRFFTTYNRTDDANRVQDILTALAFIRKEFSDAPISLVGLERAGLWCLLARALAPEIHQTAADVARFDADQDQSYLDRLYIPLLRRAGDFGTALTLAPPARLLIHNTASAFDTYPARRLYHLTRSENRLRIETNELTASDIVAWLTQSR
ncbi:MAG: hypothetical protein AB1898_30075 [Acidobacteriota bacterium]